MHLNERRTRVTRASVSSVDMRLATGDLYVVYHSIRFSLLFMCHTTRRPRPVRIVFLHIRTKRGARSQCFLRLAFFLSPFFVCCHFFLSIHFLFFCFRPKPRRGNRQMITQQRKDKERENNEIKMKWKIVIGWTGTNANQNSTRRRKIVCSFVFGNIPCCASHRRRDTRRNTAEQKKKNKSHTGNGTAEQQAHHKEIKTSKLKYCRVFETTKRTNMKKTEYPA